MVASSAPLDQFVVRNPSYFFDASPEHALVNPDNLQILVDHVKCAAFELPFTTTETLRPREPPGRAGGPVGGRLRASQPARRAATRRRGTGTGRTSRTRPTRCQPAHDLVGQLRRRGQDDTTRVIGETDFNSALEILHPKAIYIVEGRLFQVEELDFEGRKAYVRNIDCDYYTDAITYSRVTVLDTFARRASGRWRCRPTATSTWCREWSASRNQVLHERERRFGRAGPARAADAHDVVLADGARAS